jgi:hypothetical protein
MMTWLLLSGLVFAFLLRLARRRRTRVTVSPSEPISTFHVTTASRHTARKRAALDAATATLR